MFSEHRLESPPPTSRFRRPWSPDPYDPLPSTSNLRHPGYNAEHAAGYYSAERRREPSDVSVEALDLADYARTLNRNDHYLAQQPPFQPYDPYPPSPQPFRPLARTDSLSPPSLVSASASSSQSHSFSPRSPMRRPFSLPPPSFPTRSLHSDPSSAQRSRPGQEPQIASPSSEIDIAQFPSFARGWYRQDRSGPQHPIPPPASLDGRGGDAPQKPSPFDPAYTFEHDPFHEPYSPPPTYPYGSSYGSQSRYSRDQSMVPWGGDSPDGERPLDPETKEERLRMLEAEFGGKGGPKDEAEAENTVGSVNERGRLITEGPKKRLAVRWAQALLALTAAVSSIYAALIIKPPSPAPPANKLPAYLLYVLSVLTFLGCTVLFLIYPCCCGARQPKAAPYMAGPGGMMVLPVQGLPGGKKQKKGKKARGGPGEGVQVNLIVDPSMFGRDSERGREHEDDEDEEGSEALPGSYAGSSSAGRRRGQGPQQRRRGIFAGLAMEEQWKKARKVLKWGTTADVLGLLLWGMEFVVILLGKRCPVGGFEGWCDAYNLATAASCLLCLLFGLSIFFDVKDLHGSRMSPRTRT